MSLVHGAAHSESSRCLCTSRGVGATASGVCLSEELVRHADRSRATGTRSAHHSASTSVFFLGTRILGPAHFLGDFSALFVDLYDGYGRTMEDLGRLFEDLKYLCSISDDPQIRSSLPRWNEISPKLFANVILQVNSDPLYYHQSTGSSLASRILGLVELCAQASSESNDLAAVAVQPEILSPRSLKLRLEQPTLTLHTPRKSDRIAAKLESLFSAAEENLMLDLHQWISCLVKLADLLFSDDIAEIFQLDQAKVAFQALNVIDGHRSLAALRHLQTAPTLSTQSCRSRVSVHVSQSSGATEQTSSHFTEISSVLDESKQLLERSSTPLPDEDPCEVLWRRRQLSIERTRLPSQCLALLVQLIKLRDRPVAPATSGNKKSSLVLSPAEQWSQRLQQCSPVLCRRTSVSLVSLLSRNSPVVVPSEGGDPAESMVSSLSLRLYLRKLFDQALPLLPSSLVSAIESAVPCQEVDPVSLYSEYYPQQQFDLEVPLPAPLAILPLGRPRVCSRKHVITQLSKHLQLSLPKLALCTLFTPADFSLELCQPARAATPAPETDDEPQQEQDELPLLVIKQPPTLRLVTPELSEAIDSDLLRSILSSDLAYSELRWVILCAKLIEQSVEMSFPATEADHLQQLLDAILTPSP